ncbi:MAG: hypothetical protein EOP42_07600 [Sphingobacteriaceae bacterium]|nr:MAG: hypothetical protein EOP42_07600 [Sphingobacteriaceae bacterium]
MQTVNQKSNTHFYKLLQAFYELTGSPVIINI